MNILLPVDNSKFSEAAIRTLISQVRPNKSTVRVQHVVEPIDIPSYADLSLVYPINLVDIRREALNAGREMVARVAN